MNKVSLASSPRAIRVSVAVLIKLPPSFSRQSLGRPFVMCTTRLRDAPTFYLLDLSYFSDCRAESVCRPWQNRDKAKQMHL